MSRDPEMAQTLLDQRQSGKQLLLITNRCLLGAGLPCPAFLGELSAPCLKPCCQQLQAPPLQAAPCAHTPPTPYLPYMQ